MNDILWLRFALGEEIAEGQTEADTNFMDRDLEDLLLESNGNRNLAAAAGWRRKAGWILRERVQSYKVGDEQYTYADREKAFTAAMTLAADYEGRGSGGSRIFGIDTGHHGGHYHERR